MGAWAASVRIISPAHLGHLAQVTYGAQYSWAMARADTRFASHQIVPAICLIYEVSSSRDSLQRIAFHVRWIGGGGIRRDKKSLKGGQVSCLMLSGVRFPVGG